MIDKDFKVVQVFLNTMEAELAKNCLIASGINAMITLDDGGGTRPELSMAKGVRVVVRCEDYEEALQILNGEEAEISEVDQNHIEENLMQNTEAKKEFDDLRKQTLQEKVLRITHSKRIWIGCVVASLLIFFIVPNRSLAPRLSLAVLFYAVIEFFTWRDCLKAEYELKKGDESA